MRPSVVVDASTVVAALVDTGPPGRWGESLLAASHLLAPHLLPAEVANVLRRLAASGTISAEVATLAHADLLDLSMDLHPYEPLAPRIWELRSNVSSYDAWYVALAEAADVALATLDDQLRAAPGPRCAFLMPPHETLAVDP